MNRALKFRRRLGGVGAALGAILLCAFYFAFRITRQTEAMNFWVDHAQEVIGLIMQVRVERGRLTNEIWGYRASKNPELLEKFQTDIRDLKEDLRRLRQQTMDSEEQRARAIEMERIVNQQLPTLEWAMQRVQESPGISSVASIDRELPTAPSELFRELSEQMENSEREVLSERTVKLKRYTEQTHVVLILAALITGVTLSLGLYVVQREISKRAEIEQGMRQAQALLGVKYDEQGEELTHVVKDLHEQIVERRAAEERAHLLNLELEERVKERTAELQELNKEMEAFSYSVSHDLRAPLRHMHGFSRILQEQYREQLPEEAQQYLDRIRNASIHMAALVEDLLHLSRLGRQAVQHERVPMSELTAAAKAEAMFEATDREIDWKIETLPDVGGDALLLRQVLTNLLANAVKFTRKKTHAVIEIGHRREGKEEVFFVRDNGAGFDMRYADKLFGVFQRLHRQDEFEGTGIGLATVQRIINKHGGRIWAESQPDHGATFYFSLPALHKQPVSEKQMIGAMG